MAKKITNLQYDLAYIRARNDIKRELRKIIERSKKAVSPYFCLELWLNEYLDEKEKQNGK